MGGVKRGIIAQGRCDAKKVKNRWVMRWPLNIIYFVTSCWQVTRSTLLWCDTNGSCYLQKDLVKAVTVSDTACHLSVLPIQAT